MTRREKDVLEIAIKWRQAKYAIEKSLSAIELQHAIDMLIKERRDAKAKNERP